MIHEAPLAKRKLIVNSKEIEFDILELNDPLGITIAMINTLGPEKGKVYWEETKKIFLIASKLKEKIDKVFE